MTRFVFSLRTVSIAFICLLFAGCAAQTTGGSGTTFSSVRVDASAFRSQGYPEWADIIERAGNQEAQRLFAGRIQKDSPRLTIRVTSVRLSSFAGNGDYDDDGSSNGDYDNIEGLAILTDSQGKIIRSQKQLSSLGSNRAGPWYAPDNEQKRLEALAQNYVQWFERRL